MNSTVYDIATAYLIAGMIYLIMPIFAWAVLSREKSKAVNWWNWGNLIFACGLFTLGLREDYPHLLPAHSALLLFMVSNMLHVHALLLERGQRSSVVIWLAVAFAAIALKEWLLCVADLGVRHFLLSHLMLALSFLAIALIARQIAKFERSISARWLCHLYFICFAIFAVRFVAGLFNLWTPSFTEAGLPNIVTTAVAVFMGIINNIFVIGLYMERTHQRSVESHLREDHNQATIETINQIAALDRQRSMGELAAGLAHELGQPITGILLESSVLSRQLAHERPQWDQLSEIAQNISDQASRASETLKSIQNFIRPSSTSPWTALDLTEIIGHALKMVEQQFRKQSVRVCLNNEASTPQVSGDGAQLAQVFLNLLRNSAQTRYRETPLQITIGLRKYQDFIEVVLQDDGQGMSDSQISLYGSSFFSTKPDGVGIGIAISKRIVEHHGGTLHLERPECGVGLKTTLRLPAV